MITFVNTRFVEKFLKHQISQLCTQLNSTISYLVCVCEGPRSRCYGRTEALRLYCATLWWRWVSVFSFFRVMEHRWNEIYRGKPVPVPLFPPQTPYGLTRNRTRVSAVKGRRLTAWAMARPYPTLWKLHHSTPSHPVSRRSVTLSPSKFRSRKWSFSLCFPYF
jgi:hypothetical protein